MLMVNVLIFIQVLSIMIFGTILSGHIYVMGKMVDWGGDDG